MKYGDKRDYKKIDIFVDNEYVCSTTWCETCKDAIKHYKENPYNKKQGVVTACFRKHESRKKKCFLTGAQAAVLLNK